MQVYPRITTPFMPQGTSDKTNSPTPFYAPGEIGCAFAEQMTGRELLRVLLDSGATSVNAVGAVAAGQLAFWKDRSKAIVTNDQRQADTGPTGARNRVAGIFQLAVTAAPGVTGTDGNPVMYVCDLVIRAKNYPVAATGTVAAGDYAVADATASTARVVATTAGTAPVGQTVGVARGAVVANLVNVDVAIGFID